MANPALREPNPERAAEFIAGLAGIVDVQVWKRGCALLSRIQVEDTARISEVDIRQACLRALGAADTPRLILMERQTRAAQTA